MLVSADSWPGASRCSAAASPLLPAASLQGSPGSAARPWSPLLPCRCVSRPGAVGFWGPSVQLKQASRKGHTAEIEARRRRRCRPYLLLWALTVPLQPLRRLNALVWGRRPSRPKKLARNELENRSVLDGPHRDRCPHPASYRLVGPATLFKPPSRSASPHMVWIYAALLPPAAHLQLCAHFLPGSLERRSW